MTEFEIMVICALGLIIGLKIGELWWLIQVD